MNKRPAKNIMRSGLSLKDPRHLMRFMKFEATAGTVEERVAAIAKAEGVSKTTIQTSIRTIQGYRTRNSEGEMDFAIRNMVIGVMPKAQEALSGLLEATEWLEISDEKTGKKKLIRVEDKSTRIEAVKVVKDLVIGMQPKQAPVAVNVQQNNTIANQLSAAETTEERMRRLREKAKIHNALPPVVAGVPEDIDRGSSELDGIDDDSEEEEDDE